MATAPSNVLSEETLAEIKHRLAATLPASTIYLFGSHLHGTAHADSDVDIMVVLRDNTSVDWEIIRRGNECLRDLRLPLELHFCSSEKFARRALVAGSFEQEVAATGRILYGTPPESSLNDVDLSAVKAEIVREWLRKARQELSTARVALETTPPLGGIAAFHAREAAEQSLRALLQWHGTATGRIRDLAALADLCSTWIETRTETNGLSQYDETVLYPPAGEPPVEQARSALAAADQLCTSVRTCLPPEVYP